MNALYVLRPSPPPQSVRRASVMTCQTSEHFIRTCTYGFVIFVREEMFQLLFAYFFLSS